MPDYIWRFYLLYSIESSTCLPLYRVSSLTSSTVWIRMTTSAPSSSYTIPHTPAPTPPSPLSLSATSTSPGASSNTPSPLTWRSSWCTSRIPGWVPLQNPPPSTPGPGITTTRWIRWDERVDKVVNDYDTYADTMDFLKVVAAMI